MPAERYYTGKPCKRGHHSERWVKTKICIECSREHTRQYAKNHPEKFRRYSRINGRRYRAADPEKERKRAADWRCREPEKARESVRLWASKNLDKKVTIEHRRRARKRGAGGAHTSDDLARIAKLQKSRCAYCRVKITTKTRQVDHIVPLARGGHNGTTNIQILCQPCNRRKGAQDPIDFGRSLGGLF